MKFMVSVKQLHITSTISLFALISPVSAATLRVEGFLEGDVMPGPELGETMDYYRFQVTEAGRVRIDQRKDGRALLASFIGREDEFAPISRPFILELPDRCDPLGCPPIFLEKDLEVGEYVFIITGGGRTSYDVFDGYVPVNFEGGGFSQFSYQYEITGPVVGLEHWDGHLDETFTVTSIPEPYSFLLIGLGLSLVTRRARLVN